MHNQPITFEQRMDCLLSEILKELQTIRQQKRTETADVWREQNPRLAKQCSLAFDRLSEIQNAFVEALVNEIAELSVNFEDIWALREFTDKFGNVSTNLNNVMHTLRFLRG